MSHAAPTFSSTAPPTVTLTGTDAAPAGRVVRALLAAARLAPGDRTLLHGPYAANWEPVLEYFGVQVELIESLAAAGSLTNRPGAAAFEAAVYAGPADGAARTHAAAAAALVRPTRNSLAVARATNLAAVPPADALRLPDRRGLMRGAGPGGWVLHTVPGAAARRGAASQTGDFALSAAA